MTVTKYGESIASVHPVKKQIKKENPLKGTVLEQTDLISPVDVEWEALKE